jgi:hypothetical protein
MVNLLAGDTARLSTMVARKAALLYYQIVAVVPLKAVRNVEVSLAILFNDSLTRRGN